MHMQVSVIIPVFNAREYLAEAVQSALIQPETTEVLLIDDGSTDGSFPLAQKLAEENPKVRLLIHPERANLGAGATRNLGLSAAAFPFIAFLDADDYYLEHRFQKACAIFSTNPDAVGVHETTGTVYVTDLLREKHIKRIHAEMTGIRQQMDPKDLFRVLATGKSGHIHLNALVLKKDAIKEILFDPDLLQCQDSDWILRIAVQHKLYGGVPGRPVAMRRVHPQNRVLHKPAAIRYQRMYLKKAIDHHFYGSKDVYAKLYIVARYVSWSRNGWMRRLSVLSTPCILFATAGYLLLHVKTVLNLFRQSGRSGS